MAWLYQRGGVWWVGYRHNGTQVLRSTKTSDKKNAEAQLQKVESIFGLHRTGSLTDELIQALTGSGLPQITLTSEIDGWLEEAKHQTAPSTLARYQSVATEFKSFLNASATAPLLADVTTADVSRFLIQKRDSTAASTTNVTRKILAAFFKRSVSNNRLRENPVSPVKRFKAQRGEKVERRAFTLNELQKIYVQAPDDFWRYMIVGGAYTGLRMGDLISMKWGNVDLEKNFLLIEPEKVEGKKIPIPIAKPFRSILASRRAGAGKVKPSDFLWPDQAKKQQTYKSKSGYFSNQFYSLILEPLELVPKRQTSHKAKAGSTGKRAVNEISFHCLRHYFISRLKSTGSNQAVAKALAGHSSDAVNDLYTHVHEDDLTKAIGQLPEFVK